MPFGEHIHAYLRIPVIDIHPQRGRSFGLFDAVRQLLDHFTLEDYNGTHEFALFSKDYENFRKYLFNDYFLFIRGKVQPKPYNDKELEFKIISMVQLQEMRDTIKEMIVQLPIEEVTEAFIHDLTERVRESKGDTLLRLNVYDRGAQVSLRLFSKSHKVSLSQSLVGYLDDNSIHYSIA